MLESPDECENPIGRRLALVVEYDGTNYKGFQLQAQDPTVQGELEAALEKFTGEFTRIRGASRTDSGAHAKGQVVDFLTHSKHGIAQFPKALNYYLPPDIEVQSVHQMPLGFNARRSATARVYRYNIMNRPWPSPLRRHSHLWVRDTLKVGKMAAAAQALVGVHDFRALSVRHPLEKNAVRKVYRWQVWQVDDEVMIECEATGFLQHQIRRANGLLVQVGKGRCPETIVGDALEGKLAGQAGPAMLPARGLCLMQVKYGPAGTNLDQFTQSDSYQWALEDLSTVSLPQPR